jgi:3-oxoacyl-[acyl-carrier protein] reductase
VLRLASEGAKVVVVDLDRDPADDVVREVKAKGGQAVAVYQSVTDSAGAKAIVDAAVDAFGQLDILVNNAGILRDGMVHLTTEERWDAVINTHLKGTFNMIHAASPHMREVAKKEHAAGGIRYHRKIVNLSSMSGVAGNIGQANYAAAKAGIIGLTKTVAKEWGVFHINANAVAPGFIETRMTQVKQEGEEYGVPKERREDSIKRILFGRPGRPEDVAGTIFFLASPDSDFITGEVIKVNGGVYM